MLNELIITILRGNPSLEETATAVNVSPSHLSKTFVNCLHSPYSVFLLNEKIAYARILLTGSNMKISDIAAEAGFSSSSYFSDCFRRITGESPLQYRKKSSTH